MVDAAIEQHVTDLMLRIGNETQRLKGDFLRRVSHEVQRVVAKNASLEKERDRLWAEVVAAKGAASESCSNPSGASDTFPESPAADLPGTPVFNCHVDHDCMAPNGFKLGQLGFERRNSRRFESEGSSVDTVLPRSVPARKTAETETDLPPRSAVLSTARSVAKMRGLSLEHFEESKAKADKGVPKAVFADASAIKQAVREAVSKQEYKVTDLYWTDGICQQIARAHWFENLTLFIIFINALWIAVDTDFNSAAVLLYAHPVFICAENLFCTYFTMEWLFRFGSFRKKRDSLFDTWFVFDTALVFMMIFETWGMTLVFAFLTNPTTGGDMGNTSLLKLVRLVRLTRMARMARILRAIPELIILIKGIAVASRSVFFTLVLMLIIMYVFAIILRQLCEQLVDVDSDPELIDRYFSSVGHSMSTLLLDGVLPDVADVVRHTSRQSPILGILVMGFILLASLTVMNMLVGVLCEVVSVVSSVEKETLTVNYVKAKLMAILEEFDITPGNDSCISKSMFDRLLVNPDAARIIQEIGVDVVGLVDFSDYLFKDDVALSFADFMDLVLQLRGTNNSTVKDIVDLRRYIVQEINTMQRRGSGNLDQLASRYTPEKSFEAPPMFRRFGENDDSTPTAGGGLGASLCGPKGAGLGEPYPPLLQPPNALPPPPPPAMPPPEFYIPKTPPGSP
eukprot:TRINITY_DN9488_c0_g1_i1.p1 TRINITY_DN9488_c0_g1~~TRINITY_DN9488_c0_g1_i1.p1  ORF type:complete len:749 (-),score=141.38 TRINITY_DN9488_c0_g1_i1:22-2067(-)